MIPPAIHDSKSVRQCLPGLWFDSRRALWVPESRSLIVADLHLGYAWAHRHTGQMMPVSVEDDCLQRLTVLIDDYAPAEVILLGDIVHRAVPVPALEKELQRLGTELAARTTLRWIAGNHDRELAAMLRRMNGSMELLARYELPPHLLVHGDGSADLALADLQAAHDRSGCVVIGHEHPAVTLSDGVTTSLKCPCFLIAPGLVVLPAFSSWAAGSNVRQRVFLSNYLKATAPERAVAILNGKLLSVPL